MATLYLKFREERPGDAKHWIHEEAFRREMRGYGKLPDAIIRSGGFDRVIEFGGAYGKTKLENFHRFCAMRELPYELW